MLKYISKYLKVTLNISQKIMMNLWAANAPSWVGDWDYQDVPKFLLLIC